MEENLKIIKEAFFEYFKEEFYEIKQSERYTECIIHYPKIIITNEKNLEEEINDLFVKIVFKDYNLMYFIEGIRSTYSLIQYINNYSHSHLPSISKHNIFFNKFCLGNKTIISNKMQEIISKEKNYNKNDIISLLLILDQKYISWESLKGKPYKYIQKNNWGSSLNSLIHINNYLEIFLKSDYKVKIFTEIIENQLLFKINKKDLEEKIILFFKENDYLKDLYDRNKVFCEKNEKNNVYYNINENDENDYDEIDYDEIDNNKIIITFKDKPYYLKINNKNKQTITNSYINIDLINHIEKQLEKNINENYFRKKNNGIPIVEN